MAALAAMGAEIVFAEPGTGPGTQDDPHTGLVLERLFSGLIFVLISLKPALNSTGLVDGDSRPVITALIAPMLKRQACNRAWSRNALRREWALALVGLLGVIEQGNEVGVGWLRVRDADHMASVNNLLDTQDLRDWLSTRPNPKRVEKEDKDVPFNFGDWYRVDSANAYGASILTQTVVLGGWWSERIGRM